MMDNTEVIFENIEQRILTEINEAHYAIFVSVAWFTNKKLFNALLEKAKNNCYVSIIVQLDEINSKSGIDYERIKIGRSECFFISKEAELLHDKFCVIDFKKVITGSYNWTYKASQNSENILILSDPTISAQYITRFEQQKKKYTNTDNITSANIENVSIKRELVPKVAMKPLGAYSQISSFINCCHCKREIRRGSQFCNYCGCQQGALQIRRVVNCQECHREQPEPFLDASRTKYCVYCGSCKLNFRKN